MNDVEFDAANMVRRILRSTLTASLGTVSPDGAPLVTLVTVATDVDGAIVGLFSGLAAHTRNLASDGRASVLMVATGGETGDPLAGARVTFSGRFHGIGRDDPQFGPLLARFLARHPEASSYARFADFSLFRLQAVRAHLVAGFGRVVSLPADDFLVPQDLANAFIAVEPALLERLDRDGACVLAAAASASLGRAPASWRAVAVDPDGIDLADEVVMRLHFPRRARTPGEVETCLSEIVAAARPRGVPSRSILGGALAS